MARRKPDKKKKSNPESSSTSKGGSEFPSDAVDFGALNDVDPRALEGVLSNFLQGFTPGKKKKKRSKAETQLEEAQELMYQAFDARDPNEQVEIAKKALEISSDCADAFTLLAENAPSLKEATELYEKGTAAAERALGEEAFEEFEGNFWLYVPTRPYMRARLGLAQCLWAGGRREEAIEHYREMLRLNPNDNQGVRDLLAAGLLETGRDQELADLLDRYPEDGTSGAFNSAILAFRREGDTKSARKKLESACKLNPHVAPYLLGHKPIPMELPEFIQVGGEDEAMIYVANSLLGWRSTAGAIAWLRKVSGERMPTPEVDEDEPEFDLRNLMQDDDEVWQIDTLTLGEKESSKRRADEETGGARLLLITSPTDDHVVSFEMLEPDTGLEDTYERLVDCMFRPMGRQAHRPGKIEIRDPNLAAAWSAPLSAAGIELELVEELPHWDRIVSELEDRMGGLHLPPLGVEPSATIDELVALEQNREEVWQIDAIELPVWIEEEKGLPARTWAMLILHRDEDQVIGQQLLDDKPTAKDYRHLLLLAMEHPVMGDPRRPGKIEVRTKAQKKGLQQLLDSLQVECEVGEDFEGWDQCLASMIGFMTAGQGPSLSEVPGMTEEQLASFYTAAAEFYRAAPWRQVPGDVPVRLESPQVQSGPWYAVVMGQVGLTLGLALYEGRESLDATLSGEAQEEDVLRKCSSLSVMYGEAFDMPERDLYRLEQEGWPVAAPEAYPTIIRLNPGMAVRPPLVWELQLAEACLRTLPQYAAKGYRGKETFVIPTPKGEMTIHLTAEEI